MNGPGLHKAGSGVRIRPLHDHVFIRRDKPAERTAGGLFIPEIAQERDERRGQTGVVVAVGPGFEMPSGFRVPTFVKPGDRVVWRQHCGTDREVNGERLLDIVASQIEGVIEP